MSGGKDLAVSGEKLTALVNDLDDMQRYLEKKAKQLDGIVDTISTRWKGSAAAAYKELQHSVNEDVLRIREMLILIEEATKMSRDGFSAQELELMRSFQKLQKTYEGQQQILGMADADPEPRPAAPRSRIDDL